MGRWSQVSTVFVLDTSAIVAVLSAEVEAPAINAVLARSDRILLSAGTLLETHCVLSSERLRHLQATFAVLLAGLPIAIVPFDQAQLDVARAAYSIFGRGSAHAAGLNMGDCFSYALAKTHSLPLLFKGEDFAHTDITAAWRPA